MSRNRDAQRRHRQRDDGRRGHPLQHRDHRHSDRRGRDHPDEGWADRGTWTNLHGGEGDAGSRDQRQETDAHRTADDSPVRQLGPGERSTESTRRSDAAHGFGREPQGDDDRRNAPGRAPGGDRMTLGKSRGNPRTGSQRGDDSDQGISGHPGRQFGDLHGPRPSAARSAGYQDDDHFGGRRGNPTHDREFGSRHGHGSRRREDPRVRDRT